MGADIGNLAVCPPQEATNRWSHQVTGNSNALDLQKGVFALKDPKKIASSLKRSAEASHQPADP